MHRTRLTLTATALAFATTVLVAPPASAGWPGGRINHWDPDAGYDRPFLVECNNGRRRLVAEGASSSGVCGHDTDAIYVRPGEQIACRPHVVNPPAFEVEWDRTGWHEVGNYESGRVCVAQLD